jgi:hypothetical protein
MCACMYVCVFMHMFLFIYLITCDTCSNVRMYACMYICMHLWSVSMHVWFVGMYVYAPMADLFCMYDMHACIYFACLWERIRSCMHVCKMYVCACPWKSHAQKDYTQQYVSRSR